MPDVNVLAVVAAAIAAFALGGTYYAVFGAQLATVSEAAAEGGQPPPWQLGVEVLRCLVLSAVIAGLASQGEIDDVLGGLTLGLALWVGFPVVLWIGAMVNENVRPKLAVIHAGDWLAKLLVVAVIVSVWQ
jgi:hypothetical protein